LEKKEERKRKAGRGLCILFHRAPAFEVTTMSFNTSLPQKAARSKLTVRPGFLPYEQDVNLRSS
jgi:hypothetical protein